MKRATRTFTSSSAGRLTGNIVIEIERRAHGVIITHHASRIRCQRRQKKGGPEGPPQKPTFLPGNVRAEPEDPALQEPRRLMERREAVRETRRRRRGQRGRNRQARVENRRERRCLLY